VRIFFCQGVNFTNFFWTESEFYNYYTSIINPNVNFNLNIEKIYSHISMSVDYNNSPSIFSQKIKNYIPFFQGY
jgi:hypothetical protein